MDPKQLFSDERFNGYCVYCGGPDDTGDHVPSKVLLDEPFPPDLPKVAACNGCNNAFSADEPYLACLIDCVLSGSVQPEEVGRDKVRRILEKRPHFGAEILAGRQEGADGRVQWVPNADRVRAVILKLARGHAAYESSEPQLGEPESYWCAPLCTLAVEQRQDFESEPALAVWPEIGSRAFRRACVIGGEPFLDGGWQVVQPGRYRYLVMDGTTVRMVLSEYLACEVVW